ncbi:MAG TPA: zinc ribbon domain-containing protein [Pyrinomonadaceae bacterium]|jgi:hypothetical protein|nr:zinc ribbon domain-containing protein [Pyrinomonadaceae bacterium]
MYCPNCGTNNLEGARYCRSCGVDISLVPQALTGRMIEDKSVAVRDEGRRGRRRQKGEPSLEKAIKNIFMGLAFLVITLVLAFTPMGTAWWFWMFIPAFAMIGGGVAEWIRLKQAEARALAPASMMPPMMAQPRAAAALPQRNAAAAAEQFPPRSTAELVMPPPSVTEGTTRHLNDEAPTRHIGMSVENPASKNRADS